MLRRNYNHRLQWALGVSMTVAFLLSVMNLTEEKSNKKHMSVVPVITLRTVDPPDFKKVDPAKPKTQPQRRQIAYTARIQIVPDKTKTEMPELKDILIADISYKTEDGVPSSDTVQAGKLNEATGSGDKQKIDVKDDSHPTYSEAQFPGGKEAFAKFLRKNLIAPVELEAGEKKVVLVHFRVSEDGTVSKVEILQSDGEDYSKEVIRVLGKMPEWVPAMQNGIKVATWFTQPVSFIGVE